MRWVIWAESARQALDEVVAYISQESPDGAVRVLTKPVTISGKPGDDAKHYQERAVRAAIEESQR